MIDRLERLINLVIALRETARPMTAAEVRERVAGYGPRYGQDDPEAFRRMFERDKADLRALGVPVETQPVDRWSEVQGYRIDPDRYDLPPVELSPAELAALAVALQATGLAEQARSGLLKLAVGADAPQAANADDLVGLRLDVDLDAPHRLELLEAQLSRTTVRFEHQPPGAPRRRRTVDPHALVHRRGRWYLVGHDHDRGARRAFRLDRIVGRVRTVGEPGAFPQPSEPVAVEDVVPARHGQDDGGEPSTAEVAASPEVAWQVARRARGGGSPLPDGRTRFTVAVVDVDDFLAWALDYGRDVEVLGPADIRAAVVERLTHVAAGGGERP